MAGGGGVGSGGDGDPWRNRKTVRICAALDMIFPVVIMGIYVYRLTYERTPDGRTTNGFFTPKEKQSVAVFLWCMAFTLNILQFLLTYYLFMSVKAGTRDAEVSMRTTRIWLVFSNFLFVLLLAEFIFFIFFDKGYYFNGARKTLSKIVCMAELFFKPVGMYFAKDFIDDLKTVYQPASTKVQFLSFLNSVRNKPQTDASTV